LRLGDGRRVEMRKRSTVDKGGEGGKHEDKGKRSVLAKGLVHTLRKRLDETTRLRGSRFLEKKEGSVPYWLLAGGNLRGRRHAEKNGMKRGGNVRREKRPHEIGANGVVVRRLDGGGGKDQKEETIRPVRINWFLKKNGQTSL